MDVGMSVRLTFDDSNKGFPGHSVTMTGILVHAQVISARGTRVRFEFPEFKGEGVVVWTQPSAPDSTLAFVGIKFDPLKRRASKTLKGLLAA